jgi:uncharacterized protein YbjT (DUF2867 family)
MNLVVTGGTGFTGSYLVPILMVRGHAVRCLVRDSSDRSVLPAVGIEWAEGDLRDFESLKRAFDRMDALVNMASIGFGHASNIVRAALAAGIERAVFISTTAVFTNLNAPSKRVRLAAEDEIKRSRLAYTILRPTMIYGGSRDRNMCRLIRYLQKVPFIPVLGSGRRLQQPVYVGDVARAVADCVEEKATIGRCYNVAGKNPLTFNEVIDTISRLLGRSVKRIPVPASPVITALELLEKYNLRLPIKAEQVLRLNEDKAFDYGSAATDFGYTPLSFEEGVSIELKEMGMQVYGPPREGR